MPDTASPADVIPYVVNGGAMALLSFILLWWLPQLVKAFVGLTKAIRHNTETIELQGQAILVLTGKIENPCSDTEHQVDAVKAAFDRARRRAADEDIDN